MLNDASYVCFSSLAEYEILSSPQSCPFKWLAGSVGEGHWAAELVSTLWSSEYFLLQQMMILGPALTSTRHGPAAGARADLEQRFPFHQLVCPHHVHISIPKLLTRPQSCLTSQDLKSWHRSINIQMYLENCSLFKHQYHHYHHHLKQLWTHQTQFRSKGCGSVSSWRMLHQRLMPALEL